MTRVRSDVMVECIRGVVDENLLIFHYIRIRIESVESNRRTVAWLLKVNAGIWGSAGDVKGEAE